MLKMLKTFYFFDILCALKMRSSSLLTSVMNDTFVLVVYLRTVCVYPCVCVECIRLSMCVCVLLFSIGRIHECTKSSKLLPNDL